ncbi:MAG: hypothetical protein FJ038_09305 [Chloroflexi bacterium]|nr:hypothetical protein [Chloroflexota bacterium]
MNDTSGRSVGPREGLGAGIIALGILAAVLPGVVDQLPSVAGGGSAAFVLYGMNVLIGLFVIAAGVLSFFIKD